MYITTQVVRISTHVHVYTCIYGVCVCVSSLLAQFSSLERLIEGNNHTLTEALLQLVSDLQASSSNINDLTTKVDSQSRHLASLGVEVHQVTEAMERVKESMSVRLEEVKKEMGAGLTEEDVARVFAEEMDKSVENRTSVLWLWLSEVWWWSVYVCLCDTIQ